MPPLNERSSKGFIAIFNLPYRENYSYSEPCGEFKLTAKVERLYLEWWGDMSALAIKTRKKGSREWRQKFQDENKRTQKVLFSSSSSNPRLSGGRGVSHNGNYTAHPLSIYFTSGLPPPSHSISSLGFTRHASHRLLSEVTDCKIWGLYFQCSSCTPSSTPKSAVLQGCEGGKLVSLEREPICGFIPSPCLRD